MQELIKREFNDGRIWEHDIQSANEMVADYIRFLGGDNEMAEDILGIIHNGEIQLNEWDGNKIVRLIDDYINR